jgi:uncharacterized membrane protein YphA (DoxX/SURF4 family)
MIWQTIKKQNISAWLLRIGLAVVFLYAVISATLNPSDWVGFMPSFATKIVEAATLLKIFSVFELFLSLWLLSGLYTRYAALVTAVALAGIVFTNFSLFAISFRDIGLIFAALALAAMKDPAAESANK